MNNTIFNYKNSLGRSPDKGRQCSGPILLWSFLPAILCSILVPKLQLISKQNKKTTKNIGYINYVAMKALKVEIHQGIMSYEDNSGNCYVKFRDENHVPGVLQYLKNHVKEEQRYILCDFYRQRQRY